MKNVENKNLKIKHLTLKMELYFLEKTLFLRQ